MAEWIFVFVGIALSISMVVWPNVHKEIIVAFKALPIEQRFWRDVNPIFVRVIGGTAFGLFCLIAYQVAQRTLPMAR